MCNIIGKSKGKTRIYHLMKSNAFTKCFPFCLIRWYSPPVITLLLSHMILLFSYTCAYSLAVTAVAVAAATASVAAVLVLYSFGALSLKNLYALYAISFYDTFPMFASAIFHKLHNICRWKLVDGVGSFILRLILVHSGRNQFF